MSKTLDIYSQNADQFATQYDSVMFESVHQSWLQYWPVSGAQVLDIGAGSGRDSRWFVEQGCSVVAVEPCDNLRELGKQNSADSIQWFGDYLPNLTGVEALSRQFDLILLSAVWMHIPEQLRLDSLQALSNLLADDGKLVITLRHGEFSDGREGYDVSVQELTQLGREAGLVVCLESGAADVLQRNCIIWQTVVLEKANKGI